jgi:hypothetical protein
MRAGWFRPTADSQTPRWLPVTPAHSRSGPTDVVASEHTRALSTSLPANLPHQGASPQSLKETTLVLAGPAFQQALAEPENRRPLPHNRTSGRS